MIQLEHICKTYDKRSGHANNVLKDISVTFPDSGFVCILGPSGCGKTTLLNVMGGLDTFDSGTITIGETSSERHRAAGLEAERNRSFGYVFQNYYLLGDRSVTYNIYLGLHALPIGRLEKLKRVRQALRAVDMEDYSRRNINELSGGQQQRVALARALARRPRIVFADEPTGNLDEINTDNVCRLLRRISKECLVVMVTHEERLAYEYSDRIIVIEDGKILSDMENIPISEEGAGSFEDIADEDYENSQGNDKPDSVLRGRSLREEAARLIRTKGQKTHMLFACLLLFSVMTILTIGDYISMSQIRFEDFVTTDSHILEVEVIRGGNSGASVSEGFDRYIEYLDESGLDITYIPAVSARTFFSYNSFLQMNTLSEGVTGFSYIPIEKLDEESLLYGRMPEGPEEIAVDIVVLNKFLSGSGVLQASITDVSNFLGKRLTITQRKIELEIVGICDSGESSVYADNYALLSIGSAGTDIMSLSQLTNIYPEKYGTVTLADDEILAGPNAGPRKAGDYYNTGSRLRFQIKALVDDDIYAQIVLPDSQYNTVLQAMINSTRHFIIYSDEKDALKNLMINELPDELKGVIQVTVTDHYSKYVGAYRSAVAKQLGARSIITLTILLAASVMLIVLLKARVNGRTEMIAVYRLLGVPNNRIMRMFALESLCVSVMCTLPAMAVTWAVTYALTIMPSISFRMTLPFPAIAIAYFAVLLLHMLASLLPVYKLLRMMPAQLATKYDL